MENPFSAMVSEDFNQQRRKERGTTALYQQLLTNLDYTPVSRLFLGDRKHRSTTFLPIAASVVTCHTSYQPLLSQQT